MSRSEAKRLHLASAFIASPEAPTGLRALHGPSVSQVNFEANDFLERDERGLTEGPLRGPSVVVTS